MLKNLLSVGIMAVMIAVGISGTARTAQATTIYWDSYVQIPLYGQVSLCGEIGLDGSCGNMNVEQTCYEATNGKSWSDILPSWVWNIINYIFGLGGGVNVVCQ